MLGSLHHPPPFLFVLGIIPPGPSIAVVGSRQSTTYGLSATRQLAGDLAAAGIVIVSGFARGIDTAAHTAALDAGGQTLAIWGSGPDIVYPRENDKLVERVAANGGILTEFPFGTPPEPQNFPVRNRLIAGMSSGVLVTQAQSRSGALLTAQHALEQGKDVYAVPGDIGRPQFVGANELIKSGARIVTDAADILADFGIGKRARATSNAPVLPPPNLNPLEKRVWEGIGGSPCHFDRLAVSLSMTAQECAAVLVLLELKGVVKQSAGKMFTRSF
jgi:DNA processing protein